MLGGTGIECPNHARCYVMIGRASPHINGYEHSLKSPLCPCVSITVPAAAKTQITASCERLLSCAYPIAFAAVSPPPDGGYVGHNTAEGPHHGHQQHSPWCCRRFGYYPHRWLKSDGRLC